MAIGKNLQKSFNCFVWTPRGSRDNIKIILFLLVLLRCKQSDIVPIFGTFTTGVVDTGGNLPPLSLTPAAKSLIDPCQ